MPEKKLNLLFLRSCSAREPVSRPSRLCRATAGSLRCRHAFHLAGLRNVFRDVVALWSRSRAGDLLIAGPNRAFMAAPCSRTVASWWSTSMMIFGGRGVRSLYAIGSAVTQSLRAPWRLRDGRALFHVGALLIACGGAELRPANRAVGDGLRAAAAAGRDRAAGRHQPRPHGPRRVRQVHAPAGVEEG
jgi:hypothetical protein